MPGVQTTNGKAFEYACLLALYNTLHSAQTVTIEDSPQMDTAKTNYYSLCAEKQRNLLRAADAAARVIIRLEPQLQFPDLNIPLFLSIQADAQGIAGDVRDVLCIRRQNQWQIGLSCKHNHHAVKHSRLSDTIDFGKEWFNVPCSKHYFDTVCPVFSELRNIRDTARRNHSNALWANITDKSERYYFPILQAFLEELAALSNANADIPSRLIHYLIGRYDFYKVITDDRHETTRVEAINIAGTLNKASGEHRTIVEVPRLQLPTRFYHMGFKPDSDNTIEVVCDKGWTVSMRIHNASSEVEPSLKFDVNLISLPGSMHAQIEPW